MHVELPCQVWYRRRRKVEFRRDLLVQFRQVVTMVDGVSVSSELALRMKMSSSKVVPWD